MPWHRAQPVKAARAYRRAALFALLLLALVALSACDALDEPAPQAAGPNLALVSLPAWHDGSAPAAQAQTDDDGYALVDFWLDGTQNMGGINTSVASMYPHMGKKYREGGFHYHYNARAGWYENLLGDFLTAAGDARVRTIRYGNETIPDAALAGYGLNRDAADERASVWRDLHTVAQETDAGFFKRMGAEDMQKSFYALGAPDWLARAATLDAQLLENPALRDAMAGAQAAQVNAIAEGDGAYLLAAGRDEVQCALYDALPNLDLRRLSVITIDPASVRRVSGADDTGKTIAYYEQLLRQMGVFDAGLCVGVLDFQLDYLGQLSTFTTADLSEPLLWGRVILDEKKQTFENLGVMPRRLLTLVVGTRARVDDFITNLDTAINGDRALRGLRGPENGELAYAADGQTVTQQPFGFAWNHTVIARPGMGYYTQATAGAALAEAAVGGTGTDAAAADATGDAKPAAMSQATTTVAESGLPRITLAADAQGAQPDRTLAISLPIEAGADGASLDVSRLTGASLTAVSSVLLSEVLPSTPQNAAASAGVQAIAYRDKVYRFAEGAQGDAFTLQGIAEEGGRLVVTFAVDGGLLRTGYYRLHVAADATGEQVAWQAVPWIDGEQSVSASVSDAQVYEWETFATAMTEYDRDSKALPRMFQHAWGPFTEKLYHGLRVPDFPPVYRSVRLKELFAQLRAAAASDVSPLIRYTFEVFVPGP